MRNAMWCGAALRWGWCGVAVATLASGAPCQAQPAVGTVWLSRGGGQPPEPTGIEAVAVAAGYLNRLALRPDGTVWEWTVTPWGDTVLPPAPVAGLGDVAAIAAAEDCLWGRDGWSVAATTDGAVWQWRTGETPARVGGPGGVRTLAGLGHNLLALSDRGTVWQWAPCQATARQVPRLDGITAIAAGSGHGLALAADGTVWAWGENDSGQLGDGTTTDRAEPVRVGGLRNVVAVAAGAPFSMALTRDRRASRWGGLGDYVTGCGFPTRPEELATGASAIGAGWRSGYVMRADGRARAWGDNPRGELGDGTQDASCELVGMRLRWVVAATASWTGAVFLVGPAPPRLASLVLDRSRVTGCRAVTGHVTLTTPVPRGTVRVAIAVEGSEDGASEVTLAPGASSAPFTLATHAVASSRTVRVLAWRRRSDGTPARDRRAADVTLLPMGVSRAWLTPDRAAGGATVSMAVGLPCAAAPDDVVVDLAASDPALVAVPPQVTVPAGAQAVLVPVVTREVARETVVRVRASRAGRGRAAAVVLTPP